MKKILSRILFLLCVVAWSFGAQAQQTVESALDTRARVETGSGRIKLSKSPNGLVAITSIRSYVCPALGQDWTEFNSKKDDAFYSMDVFDNACWAGNDTLVVGGSHGIKVFARSSDGFLRDITQGEQLSQDDIINKLSSIATSNPDDLLKNMSIVFGEWVDAIYGNGRGKIWVCYINPILRYSDDCGKSWRNIPLYGEVKEYGEKRILDLYFLDDDLTGIFGSADNLLYVTHNNCITFTRIATPLDQGALRIKDTQQPMFNRVRIFGDYYVVGQSNKVFITKSSDIKWEVMKGVKSFDVTDDGNLVLLLKSGVVRFLDKQLTPKVEYKIPEHFEVVDFLAMGDKCYAINRNSLYEIGIDSDRFFDMFTSAPIKKPEYINEYEDLSFGREHAVVDGQEYYFDGYDIIACDKVTGKWYRYMPLGMQVQQSFVYDGVPCFYDNDDNLYSVDIKNKTIKPYQWPERLFAHKKVVEINFFLSYNGCEGNYSSENALFKLQGDKFVWEENPSINHYVLKALDMPHTSISASDVQNLVNVIEASRTQNFSSADNVVTKQDLKEFRQLLDMKAKDEDDFLFSKLNEADIERYYSHACEIKTIDWNTLSEIIIEHPERVWSTASTSRGVKITFDDGTWLSCYNSNNALNYSCVPWVVNMGDNKLEQIKHYKTFSFEIGQLLDKIASGVLIPNPFNSKAQALFQLVEYDLDY